MDYAIHTLLSRTSHAMQNYLRPHLGKLGLSPGQPKVLRCLNAMEPCSQRMLADYCEVDPAAICRMLDSLERDGFLERRPSKTDRRTGEVVLTEKGRGYIDGLLGGVLEAERAAMEETVADFGADFIPAIERFESALGEELRRLVLGGDS